MCIRVSDNGGNTWSDIGEGFGYKRVTSFAERGNEVLAGTDDGGVYINSTLLTGTDDEISDFHSVNIYPNPASNSITIEVPDASGEKRISVYNSNGQRVIDQIVASGYSTIYISNLPPGLFSLSISDGKTLSTGRFIKE